MRLGSKRKYADPHKSLFQQEEEDLEVFYLRMDMHRLMQAGFKVVYFDGGFIARKGQKLALSAPIRRRVMRTLIRDSHGLCAYCKASVRIAPFKQPDKYPAHQTATIEHRTPLSRGGTWKRYNLACTCSRCNQIKGNLTELEFLELLAQFPAQPDGRHIGKLRGASKRKQAEIATTLNSRSLPNDRLSLLPRAVP